MLVDGDYDFLNFPTNSIVSACPRNIALQQGRSSPSSSITLLGDSPSATLFLYSPHKCAIGFPQEKHLIGIIILVILCFSF